MRFTKVIARRRRRCKKRVRVKVQGTPQRPRLSVFRSNRHIYAQLIDDTTGHTLAAAGTRQAALAKDLSDARGSNRAAAQIIGKAIAVLALEKGLKQVCFDRGSYRYHGRVKALADAAREAGLKF